MMCPSLHHIRQPTMSVCPVVDDISFDHLVKGVSIRFIHDKVSISPLCN